MDIQIMHSKNNYSSSNNYPNQPKKDFNSSTGFSDTNQRVPNPQTTLEIFIKELKVDKNNLSQEIQQILSELDQYDGQINSLYLSHQVAVEECIERKCRFNITNKEMQIKRNYLNTLVKNKKNSFESEKNLTQRDIRDTIENIESLSERNYIFTDNLRAEGLAVKEIPKKIDWSSMAALINI